MKDSAFLRQKTEYRLLKYFALRNSKADARLGVLVAELLKIQCFRESTPCRRVLWLRPRRSWDHPASCSLDTGSPTLGAKQKELLRLKIIWTIGWCKSGLPELQKRMEENNTLPAPTIVNVCIPASCCANLPIQNKCPSNTSSNEQTTAVHCTVHPDFLLSFTLLACIYSTIRCVLSNNFQALACTSRRLYYATTL